MTKKIITLFTTLAISATAFAGGFVTNANQSVAFFRMPAQKGAISIDICDSVTLSAGAQRTVHKTCPSHDFINEMAFSTNSTSVGAGAKIAISDKLDLNIGHFKSFFDHLEKKSETSSTDFFRTSNALGAGLNISF